MNWLPSFNPDFPSTCQQVLLFGCRNYAPALKWIFTSKFNFLIKEQYIATFFFYYCYDFFKDTPNNLKQQYQKLLLLNPACRFWYKDQILHELVNCNFDLEPINKHISDNWLLVGWWKLHKYLSLSINPIWTKKGNRSVPHGLKYFLFPSQNSRCPVLLINIICTSFFTI